ncbi:uncharacterized protein LOC100904720 [Galendromus occidentalis]|uniref:Uncharacterized protein LOC100904720 n=1 Tax=Galendromus occidentalis TaxID=34638 RepID=A0AAJ6VZW4_9ACAR|nr:uncharacterized protein LOC100904720 [Galendromus occidentalis]
MTIPLSSDPIWRRVEEVVLELEERKLGEASASASSIQGKFNVISDLAIGPNLLPNVGNSCKKTRTSDPPQALLEHRRLVAGVQILLHFISAKGPYGQIVIISQLPRILAALMQLCHAPIRSVEPSETPIPDSVRGWLQHGDAIGDFDVSADGVVAEMQRDRLRLGVELQQLVSKLFPPAVIETFFVMLNSESPRWLKKAVSSRLSDEILRERGLSNLICAMGQVFDRDTPWLQFEKVAMLVTRPPSTASDTDYTRNMGSQLKNILSENILKSEMTLVVAIINAFLTQKPELGTELVLIPCFAKFFALLQGDPGSERKISSKEIRKHVELVHLSCGFLPRDCALLEAFALLAPLYLMMAAYSIEVKNSETSLHVETIVKLVSSLSDGVDVVLACLDPCDPRFTLPNPPGLSINEMGDIEISDGGTILAPSPELYECLFSEIFRVDATLACRICLRLMDYYERERAEESGASAEFWRVCGCLLVKLIPMCEETIKQNEDFTVRTIINNMSRVHQSEQAQEALKLVEMLLRTVDQLSTENRQRLRASVVHLENVGGYLESKALTLRDGILEKLADVEPFCMGPTLLTWKYAPTALRILANKTWKNHEAFPVRESVECLVEPHVNHPTRAKSVFGTMSEYQKVRDELLDPDVAIRGHGFIQLRKLLAARDPQAGKDLKYLHELCKVALQEKDTYIYLGAVQCYAQIVGWQTGEFLPELLDSFKETDSDDIKMRLTETLLQCVMSFGDLSPVYCEMIVDAIIDLLDSETVDATSKCAASSILGYTLGHIPNRSPSFRRAVNILISMITFEPDEILRRAAASGLAEGLKSLDKVDLIRDYPTEVRDIHRVVKTLYSKCDDEALRIHLQEILLTLGEVAKTLLQVTVTTER